MAKGMFLPVNLAFLMPPQSIPEGDVEGYDVWGEILNFFRPLPYLLMILALSQSVALDKDCRRNQEFLTWANGTPITWSNGEKIGTQHSDSCDNDRASYELTEDGRRVSLESGTGALLLEASKK